jgi:hypothetical protein
LLQLEPSAPSYHELPQRLPHPHHATNKNTFPTARSSPVWTSPGGARPSQTGLIADHIATLDFAAPRFTMSRLTMYGHPLGTCIALCLLAPRKGVLYTAIAVHGLVLESAFTSVPDIAPRAHAERWLSYRYLGLFVRA